MTLFSELVSFETLHAVILTLQYAVLALVFSWLLALGAVRLKSRILFSIFDFLWVLPGFGYALLVLTSLRALGVESRYSMVSVLAAWILAGVPYLALAIREAESDLDEREKEAGQTLGATPFQAWYYFQFKRTLPSQIAALLQQFWLYLTSFSLVMILSGGPPNETLEVAIYTSVRLDQVNLKHAWALAVWQALILFVVRMLLKRKTNDETGTRAFKRVPSSKNRILFLLFLVLGFGVFVSQSQLEWSGFFSSLGMGLGLAVSVIAICFGFSLFAYFTGLRFLAELGAFFSPMLFTLMWWQNFNFALPPLLNCILVQTVLFSPWVARSFFPLLDRQRKFDLEAARTLGATPFQAWYLVEWPRLKPTALWITGFLFSLSLTEVASVLLFSRNDFEPLSVWVQNAFLRFRLEEAMIGTAVITLLSYFAVRRNRSYA